jgi:hypothetical protein
MHNANDNYPDVMPRLLGVLLIVCGVLAAGCLLAIDFHWGGFAAYVEMHMRAGPRPEQLAIADLFGIKPPTWQLVDAWALPVQLGLITLTSPLFGVWAIKGHHQ